MITDLILGILKTASLAVLSFLPDGDPTIIAYITSGIATIGQFMATLDRFISMERLLFTLNMVITIIMVKYMTYFVFWLVRLFSGGKVLSR